jgi:hypothetical protein
MWMNILAMLVLKRQAGAWLQGLNLLTQTSLLSRDALTVRAETNAV